MLCARPRHGPRRIELATTGKSLQSHAVRREHIHEAIAFTRDVIVLEGILFCESYVQVAVDVVDAKRSKTLGDARVGEAVYDVEVTVEHLHLGKAEVRRVQELAGRRRY